MGVRFVSDTPHLFIGYRQLGIPNKNPKQSLIRFKPEVEGATEGVYETDDKWEIAKLRQFIKSFTKVSCYIREEGVTTETSLPSIEEVAKDNEEKSKAIVKELKAKIDRVKDLFG